MLPDKEPQEPWGWLGGVFHSEPAFLQAGGQLAVRKHGTTPTSDSSFVPAPQTPNTDPASQTQHSQRAQMLVLSGMEETQIPRRLSGCRLFGITLLCPNLGCAFYLTDPHTSLSDFPDRMTLPPATPSAVYVFATVCVTPWRLLTLWWVQGGLGISRGQQQRLRCSPCCDFLGKDAPLTRRHQLPLGEQKLKLLKIKQGGVVRAIA